MSSAPPLDNSASAFSPPLSMKVTPVRSTTHLRSRRTACVLAQLDFSSEIHGSTSRPSSVHLCSVSVSAIVIRSIPITRAFSTGGLRLTTNRFGASISGSSRTLIFTNGTRFANACAYGLPIRGAQNAHRPYTPSSAGCRVRVPQRGPTCCLYPLSFRNRILFPDPSLRLLFPCRVGSGSGRVLLFLDLPDCRAPRHFPALLGVPARYRTLLPEHIAIFQSVSSGGPRAGRSLELRWASRNRFPGQKIGNALLEAPIENPMLRSGFAFHSCEMPHGVGECIDRAKARRLSKPVELDDL